MKTTDNVVFSKVGTPRCGVRTARRAVPTFRLILFAVLLAVIAVVAVSCGKNSGSQAGAAETKTLYTCGMHPQIIQDHPGNCPICGMKLTPIRKQDAPANAATASSTIVIDPSTIQTMGIRTAVVERGPLRRVIRTVANVDYDETALADVTTKYKGWIEKLYVDATGALVNPGDPLFEIYSPELYSAQTEYLAALSATAGSPSAEDRALLESARTKLKFYDLSDAQIAELEKTRQAKKTLTVTAPIAGFVVEKNVVAGQMVDAGMRLYRLADIATVWVYAQIYEKDLPFIQLGQEATMTLSYLPDRKFRGRVTYIYPTVDEKTRTAKVRMEFHNPGYYLKPGMFATAELVCDFAPSALLVPDSAVLRSGQKNTVFVALPGGKFEARTVALGLQAQDDMDQVLAGLSEGERVVTSGQFMLDSESQLREAIQKMSHPGAAAATETSAASGTAMVSSSINTNEEKVVWVCPMPEHVSIEYDHPGKCPICSMTLVPVSKNTLEKIQPGGQVLYYTCPMPEHDVHSDKPGKCPKCGMTLIPVMAAPAIPTSATGTKTETPAAAQPAAKQFYTCPMHPEVISDKPGKCPKCEMDLVTAGK
ncbi:MAG TPA: efflux RND transporter periplasmic adaptor subunit [Candidatus Acidoferrum sp.]|nr:efflux RND transporter periplasmic adaptor subunit [Candidatus Acidoferrum sp.]